LFQYAGHIECHRDCLLARLASLPLHGTGTTIVLESQFNGMSIDSEVARTVPERSTARIPSSDEIP
jgi:hypothetical protein